MLRLQSRPAALACGLVIAGVSSRRRRARCIEDDAEDNSTSQHDVEDTSMAQHRCAQMAHKRWAVEEAAPNYRPPDASWPPPAERPRPGDVPALRRELAQCGGATESKCHRIGVALAVVVHS